MSVLQNFTVEGLIELVRQLRDLGATDIKIAPCEAHVVFPGPVELPARNSEEVRQELVEVAKEAQKRAHEERERLIDWSVGG